MDFYFSGASQCVADAFLLRHNANRLCSQINDRSCIDNWCINKSSDSKLFIDSGAYTAYTKQIDISIDAYIEFINSITSKVTIFAPLDVIPGTFGAEKTLSDIEYAAQKSWDNYLYMRKRVKEPEKIIPVFHQGENLVGLKNMIEYKDENGKYIPYIGLAPHLDMSDLYSWLNGCFRVIKSSNNPDVKVHSFGLTRFDILEHYPFYSCDSTSWKLSAAMGSIYTPWGQCYVSNLNKPKCTNIAKQPKEVINKVIDYVESLGFNFDDVATKDTYRYCVNIKYILDKIANYEYKGGDFVGISQSELF